MSGYFSAVKPLLIAGILTFAVISLQPALSLSDADRVSSRQWLANGMEHFRKGDFKSSMESLEKALMHDPQNQDAQFLINEITELAIQELRKKESVSDTSSPAGQSSSGNQNSIGDQSDALRENGLLGSAGSEFQDDSIAGAENGADTTEAGFIASTAAGNAGTSSNAVTEELPAGRESDARVRKGSLFGSFMNRRISSTSGSGNPEVRNSGSGRALAMFNSSGESIVKTRRDPGLTNAMSGALGKSGSFRMLSGYFGGSGDAKASPNIDTDDVKHRAAVGSTENTRVDDLNEKGLKYARDNKFDRAIELFTTVLEKEPGNLVALNNVALAYAYNDDLYSAIKAYRKIVKLTPPGSRYHKMAQSMIKKLKSII
ncbi:MAG: hypothetical protein CVV64_06135 [Candidatus Wallbacteria bacterium HGW-Wallbacteria-1]|jgi:tetratricopeptide (TPR) repeat protein|uniref:Tetratricopeptide repeat protein n=1 Tax=Candidatus Wallbacteria bacterium HGW-Wallbacteria-1 TaxID=2013854 RepID=A0A2N1PSM7_9BACT|nr:MAG: hypothetical protein CVV64_06135 [Candidatus Wallbacteria bacterium HGW-Wallbacteria-1]